MTDCSKIPTLKLVEDSKRAMEDTVAFAGSPEKTYTSELDGGVKKTISGVTGDALNAFRLGTGDPQGDYSVGVTYDEPNWTYTYNGQQWSLSKDFDLSTLPYITTEVDPNNDVNLAVRGDASQEYVQTEVTRGQGEIIGGEIFPFDDRVLQVGQSIPTGTTHLRVSVSGGPAIFAMSPMASGTVSSLTEAGATIGGTQVKFINRGEIANSVTINVEVGDSLSDSIVKALSYRYVNARAAVTINLKTGFSLQEQVDFDYIDASRITIISEDNEVPIFRSALTVKNGRWYSAFRFKNANAPVIGCLFSMDSSGTASERVGLHNIRTSCEILPGCGFKNSGERNVDNTQCSTLTCGSAIFTGAGTIGVRNATGSRVFGQFMDCSNATVTGLAVGSAGTASCADMIAKDCGTYGASFQGGTNSVVSGGDFSGAGLEGLSIADDAVVDAKNAKLKDMPARAARASASASLNLNGAEITSLPGNAESGLVSESMASISFEFGTISGEFVNSLLARRGGFIGCSLSTVTGAVGRSAFATEGGRIVGVQASLRRGVSDDPSDVVVTKGGEAVVTDLVSGGVSQTPNINTPNGIIRTNDVIKSSGATKIPEGSTVILVSHGLTVQPFSTEINVTPYSNLNGLSYWYRPVDAFSFNIFISGPAPVGGLDFTWNAEKFA